MRATTFEGGGAPATTMRTLPRPGTARPAARRFSAAPRIAATTAGAPHRRLTPSDSIRFRISSPSTRRRTMWRPAMPVTA